jgi:hypothetical protein
MKKCENKLQLKIPIRTPEIPETILHLDLFRPVIQLTRCTPNSINWWTKSRFSPWLLTTIRNHPLKEICKMAWTRLDIWRTRTLS